MFCIKYAIIHIQITNFKSLYYFLSTIACAARKFWKKALKSKIFKLQQSFLFIFGVAQNFWLNRGCFLAQKWGQLLGSGTWLFKYLMIQWPTPWWSNGIFCMTPLPILDHKIFEQPLTYKTKYLKEALKALMLAPVAFNVFEIWSWINLRLNFRKFKVGRGST